MVDSDRSPFRKNSNDLKIRIIELLRRRGPLKLSQIAEALHQDAERIRKILERMSKNHPPAVKRLKHGVYALAEPMIKNDVDIEFFIPPLDFYSTVTDVPSEIGIVQYYADASKLLQRLRSRINDESSLEFLFDSDATLINLRDNLRSQNLISAFVAGDESTQPIRYRARPLFDRTSKVVTFVTLSSILRLGGSITAVDEIDGLMIRRELERSELELLPRDIEKGVPEIEFLLRRFRGRYLYTPEQDRYSNMPVSVASEIAAKTREFEIEEFKLSILQYMVGNAKRFSNYDYVLVTYDGSILPGHLDPHIRPNSEKIKNWPQEIAREILDWKKRIMMQYSSIYQLIENSNNLVLAGIIKQSSDKTLAWRLLGEELGVPDQYLLSSTLEDGQVIMPFKPHRVEQWALEARELNIPHEKINVWLTYLKKSSLLAAPIHLVMPANFGEEDVVNVLGILYTILTGSEKHTYLDSRYHLSLYQGERPTTVHIKIVDDIISRKTQAVAQIIEREINAIIVELENKLLELSMRYNVDFGLFYYNVFRHELSPRGLRRRVGV